MSSQGYSISCFVPLTELSQPLFLSRGLLRGGYNVQQALRGFYLHALAGPVHYRNHLARKGQQRCPLPLLAFFIAGILLSLESYSEGVMCTCMVRIRSYQVVPPSTRHKTKIAQSILESNACHPAGDATSGSARVRKLHGCAHLSAHVKLSLMHGL